MREEKPRADLGWIPKTKLGKMVQEGSVVSINDVFTQGLKIMEHQSSMPFSPICNMKCLR
jgi:hypothetical protein